MNTSAGPRRVPARARIRPMAVLAGPARGGLAPWAPARVAGVGLVAALVLLGLNGDHMMAGRTGAYGLLAMAVALYASTGRLIISRLPGNAIGWLLGLIGLSLAVSLLAEQYALYGL